MTTTTEEPRLRPQEHGNRAWHSIIVETIRAGQPGPYQDCIDEYDVTFTGGHPSTQDGMELPHGIMPPPKVRKTTFSSPPQEVQVARRLQEIKDMVRPLIGSHKWDVDLTINEPNRMGAITLERFDCIKQERFSTTWRVKIRTPYMG